MNVETMYKIFSAFFAVLCALLLVSNMILIKKNAATNDSILHMCDREYDLVDLVNSCKDILSQYDSQFSDIPYVESWCNLSGVERR